MHYIAMAGLHGYMPLFCEAYDTYRAAVQSLTELHELGRRRERILRRDGSLELDLARDGNEYAEIVACDCADSSVHNDS